MSIITRSVLILFVFLYIDSCKSDDFVIGDITDAGLAYEENVKLEAIPFKPRIKTVHYKGIQVIKGISATDNASSQSFVIMKSGGIGFTYANFKLRSQVGEELDYNVQIFV